MLRILQILLALALAWAIGFWFFLRDMAHAPMSPAGLKADAVVVFTGQGGSRVSAAMALLGEGAGDRLLISGVNADITREELARRTVGLRLLRRSRLAGADDGRQRPRGARLGEVAWL